MPILSLADKIVNALGDFTAATIKEAIQQASLSNARNWRYVEAVLKNWKESGRGRRPAPPKPPRTVIVNINGKLVERTI